MQADKGKREALNGIVGRLMNVEIDLQTGATKALVAKRLREITSDFKKIIAESSHDR
jgi:hypothetical protein